MEAQSRIAGGDHAPDNPNARRSRVRTEAVPPSVAMARHSVVAAPDPAPDAHCVNAYRPVMLLNGNQY